MKGAPDLSGAPFFTFDYLYGSTWNYGIRAESERIGALRHPISSTPVEPGVEEQSRQSPVRDQAIAPGGLPPSSQPRTA